MQSHSFDLESLCKLGLPSLRYVEDIYMCIDCYLLVWIEARRIKEEEEEDDQREMDV